MADMIFVNGLRASKPRDKAPDFVKADLSINRVELITWLESQSGEWVNAQILDSKNKPGTWYVKLDTYEADKQE